MQRELIEKTIENYTDRRWPIFKVVENGKSPAVNGWQMHATLNEAVLEIWLNGENHSNVGVKTGRDSGIFVLDVDIKKDVDGYRSLDELERIHGKLPETYTVSTPSGGAHYYFKYPQNAEIHNSVSKIGAGLDVRGEGGYVLSVPSRIDGREYIHKEGTPKEVADPPRWLVDLVTGELKAAEAGTAKEGGIQEGKRNDHIFRTACSLRSKGIPYDEAERMILSAADSCIPPLPRDEALKALKSAYERYGEGDHLSHAIREINKDHFFVMLKGNACVVKERKTHDSHEGAIEFIKPESFKLQMANRKMMVDGKSQAMGSLWLNHPERREYDRIVFRPDGLVGDGEYNLWRGFSCEPNPDGDCSLFLEHIRENIADGDEAIYRYILAWMSNVVQNPGKRAGVALSLIGEQGCGKSIFVNEFGALFGKHYKHISNIGQLAGNFNAHLEDAILVNSDEATWGGDKSYESQLKRMITEPTLMIERKGVDSYEVSNFINLIITSNNDWTFPAAKEERRYFTTYVGNKNRQNRTYFKKILAEMEDGGRSALLDYLLNYDIGEVDLTKFPVTQALLDHKIESLPLIGKFWYDTLKKGYFGSSFGGYESWQDFDSGGVECERLYSCFVEFCKLRTSKNYTTISEFGKQLRKYAPESADKKRRRCGNERIHYYAFPPLDECRKHFEYTLGHEIDWDTW